MSSKTTTERASFTTPSPTLLLTTHGTITQNTLTVSGSTGINSTMAHITTTQSTTINETEFHSTKVVINHTVTDSLIKSSTNYDITLTSTVTNRPYSTAPHSIFNASNTETASFIVSFIPSAATSISVSSFISITPTQAVSTAIVSTSISVPIPTPPPTNNDEQLVELTITVEDQTVDISSVEFIRPIEENLLKTYLLAKGLEKIFQRRRRDVTSGNITVAVSKYFNTYNSEEYL